MSIVVNTPGSQVGRPMVEALLDRGADVRLIARSVKKVRGFIDRGASWVEGSLDDPDTLRSAFAGAQGLFWLSPPAFVPDASSWAVGAAERAADIAAASGVGRAVVISSIGAQHGRDTGPIDPLLAIERAFTERLPDVAVIRAGFFMQNVLRDVATIAHEGAVYGTLPPDLRLPWTSVVDVGRTAAQLLLDPSWSGHPIVGVHGPEDLGWGDMIAVIGRELGRDVQYRRLSTAQYKARLLGFGVDEHTASQFQTFFDAVIEGRIASAEPRTFATSTPTTFASFVRQELRPAVVEATLGSRRFMVTLQTRDGVSTDEIVPHLARERAVFGQLLRSGSIVRGDLELGRRGGWLVVRAGDAEAARAVVQQLPLSRWWNLDVAELEPSAGG